jgi:hypothetical protein
VIAGFHAVIGGLARQPHWYLNEPDAKRYGEAMARAARHFPLRTTQKALDVTMLFITAFAIDAPRFVMSMQLARARNGTQPTSPRGPAQVFQFVSPAAPPSPAASEAAKASAAVPPTADAPHDASSDIDAIGGEPAA